MGRSRHSIAVAGTEMVVCGVRILPFDAPHYALTATGTISRVPATGYWIETANGSYLLPGDVRTYDPTCLQPFADVSAVLAHVFLGRSAALDPTPPLLDAFVRFHLACHPRKLVLTHLHEFGREPADCWRTVHAQMLQEAVAEADKTVTIVTPEWYRETAL